jgi:hypothetical protein
MLTGSVVLLSMKVAVVVEVVTVVAVQALARVPRAEERLVLPVLLKTRINHLFSLKHYCTGG